MNLCGIFLVLVCFKAYTSIDPCISHSNLPRANYRGGKCRYIEDKSVCDRDLPKNWYRANTTTSDIVLQTTPAPVFTCGTKFPYWMNGVNETVNALETRGFGEKISQATIGSLPLASDGPVNRYVCQTNLKSNCSSTVSIKVKNCGTYYVYELPSLQSCPESYCFGENDTCPPYDPCDFYEYVNLKFDSAKDNLCGASDQCGRTNSSMWYKFTGGEDVLDFLNQTNGMCTNVKHTWVQGTPVVTNSISSHTLCVQQGNKSCTEVYHAYSKQCQGYKVYQLPDITNITGCKKLCLDTASTNKWFTCQMLEKGQGGQSNSTGSENKKQDHLWTIGLAVGVVIGAVVATVVCFIAYKAKS